MEIIIYTHRTAIKRKKASRPAYMALNELLFPQDSILDFGCGWGADVRFFERLGLDITGYAPWPGFGYVEAPESLYKLVTMFYVLNIIPTREERLEALQEARKHLTEDGMLMVATRTPQDVESAARKSSWMSYKDGYVTGSSTFQRGIDRHEVLLLADEAGLELHPMDCLLKSDSRMTVVLLGLLSDTVH
jgi:DNA phosphorothioation-associated putative methyltransferase